MLNVKLKWIEFEKLRTGLKIERVVFNDDITLLVGLSGVGKTQILNAIEYSLKLAVNKNLRLEPYNTTLCFQIGEEVYVWSYRIQQDHTEDIFESKEIKYFFAYEKLQNIKGDILMQRTPDTIQVTGYDKVPTPKKDESLLVQYSEDAFVKPIISEMLKLYPIEIEMDVRGAIAQESFNMFKAKIKESFKENEKQPFEKFSHLPVPLKIYITKEYYPQMYAQIFSAVKELFMEINSIDIVEDHDREIYMVA